MPYQARSSEGRAHSAADGLIMTCPVATVLPPQPRRT